MRCLVLSIAVVPLLAIGRGCSSESPEPDSRRRAEAAEERLADLRAELEMARDELDAAQRRNRELSTQLGSARSQQDDFYGAAVTAFAAVVALVLVLQLLLRERRSRQALGRMVRWLSGKRGEPWES